jgi:hypothetical protein
LPIFLLSGQKGKDAVKTDRKTGGSCFVSYRHPLLEGVSPFLQCLSGLHDPDARRWTPRAAAMAAVLMSLDASKALFVRMQDTRLCLAGESAVPPGDTYNGLIKALLRQQSVVLPRLKSHLRLQLAVALGVIARTDGWWLFAVDGSKGQLPRTADNEQAFGIADNGQEPQALITAVVEVHTGASWDWRIGRGQASEKHHLQEMAPALPGGDTLLLADGNFVGYDLWSALMHAGQSFLIRVGGNVHLLSELFPDAQIERQGNIVYAWPKNRRGQVPPLRLRLIRLGGGKKAVYLLSNVLQGVRLSRRSAGTIYRLRWGVEIFYRGVKRTMGLAKLKSRSAERARLELEWGLITCCILSLLGIAALHRRRQDARRLSPAALVHAARHAFYHARSQPTATARSTLQRSLAAAVRDRYVRQSSKRSRHRPRTRNTPKTHQLKPPKVRHATAKERHLATQCRPKLVA